MSTRLFVMVRKSVQPRDYFSNGAACGLRVEIPTVALESPEAFVAQIRGHMALCEIAVEEEIKRLAESTPPTQPSLRESTQNGRPTRPPTATTRPTPTAAPTPAIPPPGPAEDINEPDDAQADDEADEDAPADGRQLFGWARKQPSDMKGWIITYGKKNKFRGNVIDWNENQVARAYAAAKQALAAAKAKAR